ncbi:MAG TPA: hypothetical protein QGH10_24325 [Armatimonadota bacterium]|nr:hypothetical protein [Armatimonadota bacterium]
MFGVTLLLTLLTPLADAQSEMVLHAEAAVARHPDDWRAYRALSEAYWDDARRQARLDGVIDDSTAMEDVGPTVARDYRTLTLKALTQGVYAAKRAPAGAERAQACTAMARLNEEIGELDIALNWWRIAERADPSDPSAIAGQRSVWRHMGLDGQAWIQDLRYGWAARPRVPLKIGHAALFIAWIGAIGVAMFAGARALVRRRPKALIVATEWSARSALGRAVFGVWSAAIGLLAWLWIVETWFRLTEPLGVAPDEMVWFSYRTVWIGLAGATALGVCWLGKWAWGVGVAMALAPAYSWWVSVGAESAGVPLGDRVASVLCVLAIPLGMRLADALRKKWEVD